MKRRVKRVLSAETVTEAMSPPRRFEPSTAHSEKPRYGAGRHVQL